MADENDDGAFEMVDDGGLDAATNGLDMLDEEGGTATNAPVAAADDSHEMLYKYHPETIIRYAETIDPLVPLRVAPPTADTSTSDERHSSPPFLTIYERTKILGTRANQLADGAIPYIHPIPEHITQPLDIAKLELENRMLPFIVERPMPDGTFEYWRLSDLMIL